MQNFNMLLAQFAPASSLLFPFWDMFSPEAGFLDVTRAHESRYQLYIVRLLYQANTHLRTPEVRNVARALLSSLSVYLFILS